MSQRRRTALRVFMLAAAGIALLLTGGKLAAMDLTSPLYESPPDIWKGYDPASLPLDIEVLSQWQKDGCWYEKLRFTGEIADGVKTRILAIRGGPAGGKGLPGVLHIHGGGQTLSQAWVEYWAARGYVCVSFDFCGKAYDRTEYTEWGPLETCNMPKAGDGVFVKPDLRASSWYHWVLACRRALTLLGETQGVDRDRMGIFGISGGGTLCWMVAGCDSRVKAAAPIYGCGYNIDPRRDPREAGPPDADHLYFRRILAPEAWAPYMKCPVLFLSATNDMHGRMPTAYEILKVVQAPVRQVFTPRYDHHVEPEQSAGLPLWMDWQLKSGRSFHESPVLKLSLDSRGVPAASVTPDRAEEVSRVVVYYSLDDKAPGARFWRTVHARKTGGTWNAGAPVVDTWKSLSVFANVFYRTGECLSSNLACAIPSQMGIAQATLSWTPDLDGRDIAERWYFVPAYTDPNVNWSYLAAGTDPKLGPYLTLKPDGFGGSIGFYIGTHIIGDEQFRGRAGMALAFATRGGYEGDLTVMVVQNDRLIGSKTYSAAVKTEGANGGWLGITLPLDAFKSEDGAAPQTWEDIDKINITGTTAKENPPCFRAFRWVETKP